MDKFTTLLASGLSVGAITAVVALGFLVLYKATGVVNFAHGDLMTLGAYLAMWASTSGGMPVLVAYLVALVLMAVVGAALERVAFVPLRGKSPLVVLIATLGVALIIRAAVTLWQGPRAKPLAGPVGNGIVRVAGAPISDQTILVVAVSAVAVLGCVLLFRNTPFGRQVRALAVDDEMAALCGVKVKRVSLYAFMLSAVLAGLAGILLGPLTGLTPTFGFNVMLTAFAAAIIGGFGSLGGTVWAALALGLVQQLVGGYIFTDYASILPFVVMFIAIVLRPKGIVSAGRKVRV